MKTDHKKGLFFKGLGVSMKERKDVAYQVKGKNRDKIAEFL